jgi:phosphate transport system substrate-binding protein
VIDSRWLVLTACAVLSLSIVACGDDDGEGTTGGGGLSGTINIDGSSTVYPFAQAAAENFQVDNPDVKITVGQSGTGGGFEKFCAGETDISDASRPIDPKHEVPVCKKGSVTYTELQVASDGIAISTNPALEISCLTTEQLKQLWNKGSKVKSYSDLGKDADTGQALPDTKVNLFGPGTDSGTFDFFTDEINGEEGASRKDYQPSEDDNVLVQGVSGDEGGLGYFGFSYYEQNAEALNLVAVDAGDGCIVPAVENIQAGEYKPLSRPLFMYPSNEALQRPEVAGFMQYVLDNYERISADSQIVPMPSDAATKSQDSLQGALAG